MGNRRPTTGSRYGTYGNFSRAHEQVSPEKSANRQPRNFPCPLESSLTQILPRFRGNPSNFKHFQFESTRQHPHTRKAWHEQV